MSDGVSITNLFNSAGMVTLGTNIAQVDATDDLLANMFDTSGMLTTRLANSVTPGTIDIVVDLGSSATRNVIAFASNVKAGTATVITQSGADATVETFASLAFPGFPAQPQAPFSMNYIRPTSAFQKIKITWTVATGDPNPVEIYYIHCGNDVIEIPDKSYPVQRSVVGVNQIVNGISHSRGVPLTLRFFTDNRYPHITKADMGKIYDLWNDSNFAADKFILFPNYGAFAGLASTEDAFIYDVTEVPRHDVIQQQADVFELTFSVQTTSSPVYPEQPLTVF